MTSYIKRLVDPLVALRLEVAGAVVLEGPKACGKTETARHFAASEVLLDVDTAMRTAAMADPRLALDGATPRLLDEWQVVPELWNAVRRAVDDRRARGQFILTGSAQPTDDLNRHSGAGRFSRIRMRPLTLIETGHAQSAISLDELFDGVDVGSPDYGVGLERLVERMIAGGWPAAQSLSFAAQARYSADYLDQITRLELAGLNDRRHDPRKITALLRSLARTTASEASVTSLARDAGGADGPLSNDSVSNYLDALHRTFILESAPAWDAPLRTATPLRKAPKRHLADTSLSAAALRISEPSRLISDPATLGLFFESLVYQQLRVFADVNRSEVYHFRSKTGLEVDHIIERNDGALCAFETKLGAGAVDQGAATLKRFAATVDRTANGGQLFLGVIVPTGPSYVRSDGVAVLALTSLGA